MSATGEAAKDDMKAKLLKLERARRAFGDELRAYERAGGRYIDRAREPPQELVSDCRFMQNRIELLKRLPKGGVVAEVGTDEGKFAAQILTIAEPLKLHVFELDVTRIKPENLQAPILAGRCKIHAGDSSESLAAMPDGFFDWIYIDGDHSYSGVRKDIQAAVPKLKKSGLLVFNDYTVWSISSMGRCGVAKAVNEFAVQEGWRFLYFAFQGSMYFDVAIFEGPRE